MDDAKRFLKDKPKVYRVFIFTPEAKAELINKTNCQIINPLDYYSDFGHKRTIVRLSSIENKIYPIVFRNSELSEASKETFRGVFHLLAGAIFYIHYNIRMLGPWSIYNGNIWQEYNSIEELEIVLMQKILFDKNSSLNFSLRHKIVFPGLVRLINNININKLKGKKVYLFSGSVYGLPFIKKLIKNKTNNRVLNILSPSFKSFLKSIITIFNNDNEIYITNIPKVTKNDKQIIKGICSHVTDKILVNVLDSLENMISDAIIYTHSIEEYVRVIFNKVKPKVFITHQLRWLDGAVFGQVSKENKVQSILISHGSHPVHREHFSYYEHKDNARGLLYSPFASKTLIQSPNTISSLDDCMSNIEKIKSRPIMWGDNTEDISMKNLSHKNERIILHAGTFKELGMRPWIYETSNEYIYGLQLLVEALSQLKNTRLIIKIRPSLECGLLAIKKLIPQSDNCQIITKGSFLDYLEKARLLVSFSSTTIEEALYARKPVALFGGTERYRHLDGSKKKPSIKSRYAVYHLRKNNLPKMLDSILDVHESPLTDEELKKYTWDVNIPGRRDFINHI